MEDEAQHATGQNAEADTVAAARLSEGKKFEVESAGSESNDGDKPLGEPLPAAVARSSNADGDDAAEKGASSITQVVTEDVSRGRTTQAPASTTDAASTKDESKEAVKAETTAETGNNPPADNSQEATTQQQPRTLAALAAAASSGTFSAKKFSSSLSVNKKFLEKTSADGVKTVLTANKGTLLTGRSTTPTQLSSPLQSSPTGLPQGPRLLSGKIVPKTRSLVAPAQSFPLRGPNAGPNRLDLPWARVDRGTAVSMPGNAEFPSVAEAARSKELKARAMATALAAKEAQDKKSQEIASQAAAAYRKHLLEESETFRGAHLDPNMVHWDDMGDDDDFGDVVDFGDGAQYKIPIAVETAPTPPPIERQPAATTQKPLHEFDRGERSNQARPSDRSLFNDRLGKFEPYSRPGKPAKASEEASVKEAQVLKRDQSPVAPKKRLSVGEQDKPAQTTPAQSSTTTVQQQAPPISKAAQTSPSTQPASQPVAATSAPTANVQSQPADSTSQTKPAETTEEGNIEEMHQREMHAAAERARKRRADEEAARQAQLERARLKAAEVEARINEAKAKEVASAPPPRPPVEIITKAPPQSRADETDMWRRKDAVPKPAEKAASDIKTQPSEKPKDSPAVLESSKTQQTPKLVAQTQQASPKITSQSHSQPQTNNEIQKSIPTPPRSHSQPSQNNRQAIQTSPQAQSSKFENRKPNQPTKADGEKWQRKEAPTTAQTRSTTTVEFPPPEQLSTARSISFEDRPPRTTRNVSFSLPTGHDASDLPNVRLSPAATPNPESSASGKRQADMSAIEDALDRVRGAMVASQEARAEAQATLAANDLLHEDRHFRKQVEDDLERRHISNPDAASMSRSSSNDFSFVLHHFVSSSSERPASPKPVWKVPAKVKVAKSNKSVLPIPAAQQRIIEVYSRKPDRQFIVTWHVSHAEKSGNLFREHRLFQKPDGPIRIRLPGDKRSLDTTTESAEQSRAPDVTAESRETVQDADLFAETTFAHSAQAGPSQITVALPGSRGKSQGKLTASGKPAPSVKLPNKNAHVRLSGVAEEVPPKPKSVEKSSERVEKGPDPFASEFIPRDRAFRLAAAQALGTGSSFGRLRTTSANDPNNLSAVKAVWAQPSPTDERGLKQTATSNSLQGLLDDFPTNLPTMNDLRLEDATPDIVTDGLNDSSTPSTNPATTQAAMQKMSTVFEGAFSAQPQPSSKADTFTGTNQYQQGLYNTWNPPTTQGPSTSANQYPYSQTNGVGNSHLGAGIWLPPQFNNNARSNQGAYGAPSANYRANNYLPPMQNQQLQSQETSASLRPTQQPAFEQGRRQGHW